MGIGTKAILGLVAGATVLTAATPAEAQWRHRYYRGGGGGDAAAAAIIGGVAGLAIGSAIANNRRDRYYDDGYYAPRRGYYDDYRYNYYDGPRYRDGWRDRGYYRQRCVTRWQYDPYIGRDVRVRYC